MAKYLTSSWIRGVKSVVRTTVSKISDVGSGGGGETVTFSKLNENYLKSQKHFTSVALSNKERVITEVARSPNNSKLAVRNTHEFGDLDAKNSNEFVIVDEEVCTGCSRDDESLSAWQAGFNVTNAIQGMSIVSLPYTVLEGGYMALISMLVVAQVCCYTGDILVDCLYEPSKTAPGIEDQRQTLLFKRVRDSYVAIAEEVWGKRIGGRVVYLAQLIELVMTCILYVLLCGELLLGMFPGLKLSLTQWIAIVTFPLLLCSVLKNMKHVAWLSFWCAVSHVVSNGVVFIYCLTMIKDWKPEQIRFKADVRTLPISLGIVIFSYTSQVFLPSIEGSMREKKKFKSMMLWSHVTAAVFKVTFAFVGFASFGEETEEVITNNLPSRTLKVAVNIFLVVKALLSFPLPFFATMELIGNTFFTGRPFPSCYTISADGVSTKLKPWGYILRALLVCFMSALAASVPHFAILLALIGSFTGNMLSLVWPAYFHLVLKKQLISWYYKLFDVAIILLGLICCALGIIFNGKALYNALHGLETKPFQGYI